MFLKKTYLRILITHIMFDLKALKENFKTAFLVPDYERLISEEAELLELAKDPSMSAIAEEDLKRVREAKANTEAQFQAILDKEKEEEEIPNNVIIEIRAGAGGDEAGLFAHELAEAYERYAVAKKWGVTTLDVSENANGGYKEVTFEVAGKGAYAAFRYETGVHRVQRVPATEKMGRVHTSTCSVAVLPIRKKPKYHIAPADIDMEFCKSGGKGGQNVNKVETAVRLIHRPTGMEVRCSSERSQMRNRERAMEMLQARLELVHDEEEAKKHASERKSQIGTADRSEKIRTYNFPQNRITDHRIKKSWYAIEKMMQGELEPIFSALASGEQGTDEEE